MFTIECVGYLLGPSEDYGDERFCYTTKRCKVPDTVHIVSSFTHQITVLIEVKEKDVVSFHVFRTRDTGRLEIILRSGGCQCIRERDCQKCLLSRSEVKDNLDLGGEPENCESGEIGCVPVVTLLRGERCRSNLKRREDLVG